MEATLLTLGVLLILVGLIGQVKAQQIEVGTKNPFVRIILGLIGVGFVFIALSKSISFPPLTAPTNNLTLTPLSPPTASEMLALTPIPTTIAPPSNTPVLPTATSVPPTPIPPTPIPPTSVPPTPIPPTPIPPTIPPATIPPPTSEIDKKYVSLGGEGGFLGAPTTNEMIAPDTVGHYRHFQNGSIYWIPNTGAHEVHGYIRGKWADLGWERSVLGYPSTDELTTPDGIGRYNHFQNGSIYWTPNTGAHEVHGYIRGKWADLGWERSCLGYPISDEEPSSGEWERQSRFEHGIIKWSRNTGAASSC